MNSIRRDKTFPTSMRTLSEVMEKLRERGIEEEFTFSEHQKMKGFDKLYNPEDLMLVRTFRFEGMSDPADNVALYLFEDTEGNVGYVLDVYGSESNYGMEFSEFLKAIPVQNETME
ncbi:hypothetical protein [Polluticaenibacter yanchengensis]|uniref:Phosphoribosylpyrophosphate synthetase n=1 Tax=Polluticaenibacter yanchengensis TaxID=3014562 RepID=A0ABT4UMF6_9BACT|nr:hypothetical protein [Chitinophagaceae bacterium LY-5]